MRLRSRASAGSQTGTLLLDSLTAIAILAIVFAVSFPNYARAQQQARVRLANQQLENLSTAAVLYGTDHRSAYTTDITTLVPKYMAEIPISPLDTAAAPGTDYAMKAPNAGSNFEVYDQDALGTGTATDITLFAEFARLDGSPCQSGDKLAIEDNHPTFCETGV